MGKSGRIPLFKRNPDRARYRQEYREELHRQARALHLPGALVGLVAWLGFALDTDHRLHPEFPGLIYFRLLLSAISLLMLIVILIDALSRSTNLRGKGLGWLLLQYAYVLGATAFFTGRIADDPNYVSGLQIVIMLMIFMPIPRVLMAVMYTVSIMLFIGAVFMYRPDLSTGSAQYSMQNLGIAYLLGFVLAFVFDTVRFNVFNNHRKVVEKSAEVQQQMERVRTLKNQQDGDYFLTSILIKPLIMNEAPPSTSVSVDFYLNQKKKFAFKHHNSEIGGDYLYAGPITLARREYMACINGDAMGKSIQGAGGALVLGTVFRSIISRTRTSSAYQNKFPEKWLKDCFAELQSVFVTFDGSMLISIVVGLVDVQTGMLYYINAEHPWPVLYRDGQAQFLGADTLHRKIGISGLDSKLHIRTFRMRPDDVVILGSDGRDDIALGETESGQRIINENETLFLQRVQDGRGELNAIVHAILNSGSLTDDLSMMRIAFREDAAPASAPLTADPQAVERAMATARSDIDGGIRMLEAELQRAPEDATLLRQLAEMLAQAHRPEEAARICERYITLQPEDGAFLEVTARMWKRAFIQDRKIDCLEKAADFGERCRLRNRDLVSNLINLSDVYRLLKNKARARKILAEVLEFNPDHPRARKLADLLN